jgi:hypothetical protein
MVVACGASVTPALSATVGRASASTPHVEFVVGRDMTLLRE